VVYGFFGDSPPASTLIGVQRLADARYLVEVEATAVSD
jgi:enamine deaminase RidA (YjgF/YER057c/UK114 family)